MQRQLLLSKLRLFAPPRAGARAFSSSAGRCRAFAEGDVVLLRGKSNYQDGKLIKLAPGKTAHSHRGFIKHDDMIGKQPRQTVRTNRGEGYRLHEPTLAEFVRLTPRLVTPIYPSDANLIVSLLDLHVDTYCPSRQAEPPLEILEAGTGHGALTLHLSRAIHAANPPLPPSPASAQSVESDTEDAVYNGESVSDLQEAGLESWKASRKAIVHTLDISSKHSKHARKIVRGFRHAMYYRNVEFHVGDVSEWIASQKVLRNAEGPFLSHVFLDLPNADSHIANVAPALHVNGMLCVFNPSITQIADCAKLIHEQRLPFVLDQVVELGAGSIRKWDVRAVQPRVPQKKASPEPNEKDLVDLKDVPTPTQPADTAANEILGLKARDSELEEELAKEKKDDNWVMVCRPKAGEMVVGGGFLAVWRRMEPPSTDTR